MREFPGLAGDVYKAFLRLREMDDGLAIGGMLSILDWAAGGRYDLQLPCIFDSPETINKPVFKSLTLIGDGDYVIDATEIILAAVDGRPKPLPGVQWCDRMSCLSCWKEPRPVPLFNHDYQLLVPATGRLSPGTILLSPPFRELTESIRSVHRCSAQVMVRMNDYAEELLRDHLHLWKPECKEHGNITILEGRVRRWTNVASLLTVGSEPLITADTMIAARHIAIIEHERAWSTLQEMEHPHGPVN